jgi:hypothetical protein
MGELAGRVAEWLKASDSKSEVGVTLPEVRILSLPPIPLRLQLFHVPMVIAEGAFSIGSDFAEKTFANTRIASALF